MIDDDAATDRGIIERVLERGTPLAAKGGNHQCQDKYINCIRKSSLGRWFLAKQDNIPVPEIPASEQTPFIRLVDQILKAKAADPKADTQELEENIDWLVYDLYGLSNEETAVVADFFWEGTLTEEQEDRALLKAMEESDIYNRVTLEEVLEILRSPDEG